MVRKIILLGALLLANSATALELEFYKGPIKNISKVSYQDDKITLERNTNLYIAPQVNDLGVIEFSLSKEKAAEAKKLWHTLARIEEKYSQKFHQIEDGKREKIKIGKAEISSVHREYPIILKKLNEILRESNFKLVEGFKVDPSKNSYIKVTAKEKIPPSPLSLCPKEEEVCVIEKIFFYYHAPK